MIYFKIGSSVMVEKDTQISGSEFLDIHFDQLSFDEAVDWLSACTVGENFRYIVTPNVDHIVRISASNQKLNILYDQAALRLCDSKIISGLASLAKISLPVVPGSDLAVSLFDRVVREEDELTVIGSHPLAVAALAAKYPKISIHHIDPPMGLRDHAGARLAVVTEAKQYHSRFVLLAVGSPQQEMLAYAMSITPGITGTGLCIGAGIDFIVGKQRRAPKLMQQFGFEWLWRLASDPLRLWRRYLIDGPRIFTIFYRWIRKRRNHSGMRS